MVKGNLKRTPSPPELPPEADEPAFPAELPAEAKKVAKPVEFPQETGELARALSRGRHGN